MVDYLGIGECLRRALSNYTDNGGKGETAVDQNEAVAVMMSGFLSPATSKTSMTPSAMSALDTSCRIAVSTSACARPPVVTDDLATIALTVWKNATSSRSVLSEEFLDDLRGAEHKNLAAELLRKLLHDELKTRRRKNVVQAEGFSEKLERTITRYHNRAIATVHVIEELIALAREMNAAGQRGEELGLSDDELAFYDALGINDSAVQVLGDALLKQIARELTETIRRSVTIDWTVKETVRAKLRTLVRRKPRQHGYPPDKAETAVTTILKQAESLAAGWAG